MNRILSLIEGKIKPKYLIYLSEKNYKLYKNINKEVSSISNSMLDNKIYEVLEIENINDEDLYLIGVDDNELGWVSVKNPILILNSFSEQVSSITNLKNNDVNDILEIQNSLSINKIYNSKYICKFNDELYVGIEDKVEFLGFYAIDTVDFGNIEEVKFKFDNSRVNVYHTEDLTRSQMIITSDKEYNTKQYYKSLGLGTVKIGNNIYWFKGNETNINHSEVKQIVKDYDEYYLEHLIQSIKFDKSLKAQDQDNSVGINQEYIDSLKKRINQLKEKNHKYLELIRENNKEIRDKNLELNRKSSKINYLDRLSSNLNKKNDYYVERNEKLEKRVKFLEEKQQTINDEYKKLKNSKLVRIQSKFLGK